MTSIAQNPNTQMLNSFLADSEIQEMLVEQGEGVPAKKFVKDDDLIDKKRFITSFGRQNLY